MSTKAYCEITLKSRNRSKNSTYKADLITSHSKNNEMRIYINNMTANVAQNKINVIRNSISQEIKLKYLSAT